MLFNPKRKEIITEGFYGRYQRTLPLMRRKAYPQADLNTNFFALQVLRCRLSQG